MLVLTRKAGQGIVIGDDIIIKIVEVKGGNIRIGIDAPGNRKIYRQELYDKIAEENRTAVRWDITDLENLSVTIKSEKKR